MTKTRGGKKAVLKELSSRTKVPYKELDYYWIEIMDIIKEEIKKGNMVVLDGLGSFTFKDRAPKMSNMTKEMIPRHKQLIFKINQRFARYIRVTTRQI